MPTHQALVAELRQVRLCGLIRLRSISAGALSRMAALAGLCAEVDCGPAELEALLRQAAQRLGGGRLQEAAEYTFGLVQGTRDWPAQDRRRAAAKVYQVSVDRFRKHYEQVVFTQTAEALLGMTRPQPPRSAEAPAADSFPASVVVESTLGGARVPVTIHRTSVELVRAVDVIVCPTNTFFQLASTYKQSVAASLRWAGARKSSTGEILADSMNAELDKWRAQNIRWGLAVAAGTVAPLAVDPSGDLHFRRIYCVAVAEPVMGTNEYRVSSSGVERAVRSAFEVGRAERASFDPPLGSMCFPLLGAGRGNAAAADSLAWILRALDHEMAADPAWDLHFVTHLASEAETIRIGLTDG